MSKKRDKPDKAVVDAFVAYRRATDLPDLHVERYPDEENSNTTDIDAVAGHLAIEHTSVDTLLDQRGRSAWFSGIAQPIEQEIGNRLDFRLDVVFPYEGVAKGQDWKAERLAIEAWILNTAGALPDGRQSIELADVAVAFEATKASDRKPGVFFRRRVPHDASFADRLREQIVRKAAKLPAYRSKGKRGVLLVESNDIALMNRGSYWQLLEEHSQTAFPKRSTSCGTPTPRVRRIRSSST